MATTWVPAGSFGVRLLLLRRHLGLTQRQIAARCDLDDGSWSNWEKGSNPRNMPEVVEKVAAATGVDRDWGYAWGVLFPCRRHGSDQHGPGHGLHDNGGRRPQPVATGRLGRDDHDYAVLGGDDDDAACIRVGDLHFHHSTVRFDRFHRWGGSTGRDADRLLCTRALDCTRADACDCLLHGLKRTLRGGAASYAPADPRAGRQ